MTREKGCQLRGEFPNADAVRAGPLLVPIERQRGLPDQLAGALAVSTWFLWSR